MASKQTFKNNEIKDWKHFALRIDNSQHQWLKSVSDEEQISINKVINNVLIEARIRQQDDIEETISISGDTNGRR